METVLLSIIIVLKLDILTYLVTIVKVGSVLATTPWSGSQPEVLANLGHQKETKTTV